MRRAQIVPALLLAIGLAASSCSDSTTASSSDGDAAHPKPREVFLEPFDRPGANAFGPSVALAAVPAITAAPGVSGSQPGSLPGLFGGTRAKGVCDPAALIRSLRAHDDRAQAWVDALNSDATLQWSGGAKLAVDDVEAYVEELTPVVVRSDTRVTGFGLLTRRAIAHQAILQHGTAVLVDALGLPRTRCASESPLTRPTDEANPRYRGVKWDGFSSDRLVVVTPGLATLESLRVLDLHRHNMIEIPVGSACCVANGPTTSSTTALDEQTTTTTTRPRATTTTHAPTPSTTSTTATPVSNPTSPTTTTTTGVSQS